MTGIDGDEKGIDTFLGIGAAVGAGRTDRQRPCRRLVPKSSTSDAAVNAHRRRKPNQMLLRRRAEMHAAAEPQAENRDAAFAWCAYSGRGCRQAAILRQAKISNSRHHARW